MQVVFEFTQQEGMLVGFWCPAFVGSNLNVPGFHFHFLSTDKQRGGHVLQMELQAGATAYLQEVGCASPLGVCLLGLISWGPWVAGGEVCSFHGVAVRCAVSAWREALMPAHTSCRATQTAGG